MPMAVTVEPVVLQQLLVRSMQLVVLAELAEVQSMASVVLVALVVRL
jgi:hypothetical protein